MNRHENARMTFHGRALLVRRVREERWRVSVAAEAAGISLRTAYKWLARHRAGGERMLHDRSSAPARCPHRLPADRVAAIEELRRRCLSGPKIANALGLPRSTVGAVLRRLGLGKLAALEPKPAPVRYERARPGELIHLDTKKLGRIDGIGHRITGDRRGQSSKRGTGWEALHVAVDDASRLAYTELLPDEKKESACAFLSRALAFFAAHGVTVERVMTDNGSPYISTIHALACRTLGIRHLRTRPRRPQTNGKAERLIRTMLGGWAYSAIYASSRERTAALDGWLHRYNHHRPHRSIGRQPPITRLNTLLGTYT